MASTGSQIRIDLQGGTAYVPVLNQDTTGNAATATTAGGLRTEAFGPVRTQATYGAAPAAGTAVSVSRSDHVHGTVMTPHAYSAAATGSVTSFTTETDIPGASVQVAVSGSASTVMAWGVFDMQVVAGATLTGFLNWHGTDRPETAILQASGAGHSPDTVRATTAATWMLPGVTAGTYTAKLRASCSASGASIIQAATTVLRVLVIEGP